MIQLKEYQQRVLDSLRDFLWECGRGTRPEQAFPEVQARHGQQPAVYLPLAVAGLSGLPYVCIRVPTGGGKTLLAAYVAGMATPELLHWEHSVVLWLVPSKTILDQTADALRDPRHPYRRALELSCGAVEVFTVEEALHLTRARMDGQTSVIVGTIQSFRVEDTTGRKVYETNGELLDHFSGGLSGPAAELFLGADGKPKPSLVNALRMRRPVVIVDEVHNARTELSFSTLGGLLPSCIIEFTATPARMTNPSNVLHRVSAYELKAEKMIKLPLRIVTRHPSQRDELLSDAMNLRAELEKRAVRESQDTGEYLRPIMLLQAERVDGCEPLRGRLVKDFNIAMEEIKISTGKVDELQAVPEISSPKCPVRFVITVEKLREGWDCPFAYVLCSLKETHSATAIEQIVGRILRLPGAKEKRLPDLNCAYAFSVSSSLNEVLNEFREALENNGFTRNEAERIIVPVPQWVMPLGAQECTVHFEPGSEIEADVAAVQLEALGGKVQIDVTKGDIKVVVPLDEHETEKLLSCVKTLEAKARVAEVVALRAQMEKAFGGTGLTRLPSPYELRLEFVVPRLCVVEGASQLDFDSTLLMERPWRLSAKDASPPDSYNPLARPESKAGVLDVTGSGAIQILELRTSGAGYDGSPRQMILPTGDWTLESLVAWLDSHIQHQDIPAEESAAFLLRVVRGLIAKYQIQDIRVLVLDRFRLKDEAEALIQRHRFDERKTAFQQFLLPDSALQVNASEAFDFAVAGYEPSWLYDGTFEFKNHYFAKPGELAETTPSGALTEEFLCARFIDDMPEVRFWVRNLSRKSSSFRLHTSTDWFYPDFVCMLKDSRILAVEYKGKYIYDASDAQEKRAIGEVWEARSEGKCLFAMPTERDFSVIEKKVRG